MELYPSVTALDLPFKKKLQESLKIWGYCFLGFIVSAIIISFTDLLIKMAFHIDIAKTNQITTVFSSPIQKFLLFPFLVPFLEECIFRLWQDYKVSHLIMAAGLILTLILFRITGIHLSAFKYIYEGILALLALIFMVSTRKSTTPALSVSLKKKEDFLLSGSHYFWTGAHFQFRPHPL
ncbi:hypothetical protein SAMN05192529_102238 [Arachidicoccus rhizosphaerae]|jgi:hypothetical protein|uniref:Uncharacterized protein n=1 Tax=Arachidicoccus rhizosphaerae TaxID=551991 RepID=A0A1H3W965_9BACT|nr:hypothetical protein [Arachidicoccus rhizosphaerae]SDZ83627.1 hypothetical protein SAMN05192529_102238 [Arachidicoccus rhizosphaerae]